MSSGGLDWLAGSGKVEKADGGYRVTARKIFASGCPAGQLLMTSCVYDDPENGPTVLHFPVPLGGAGVTILDTWRTLGMRGTASNDILIDGVFVPEAAIGARRPQGKWHPLFHLISLIAFPLIYSVYVGIAEAARDLTLPEATKKRNDPNVQCLVGEMENELTSAQLALQGMISLAATAEPSAETTNATLIRRTLVGRAAMRTVEKAMEVVGGGSFNRSLGLDRLYREVQAALPPAPGEAPAPLHRTVRPRPRHRRVAASGPQSPVQPSWADVLDTGREPDYSMRR